MSNIQTSTLENGLRVITDRIESVETVALGIWVGVGTRNEDLTHNGVAHMVEHMLFKGTGSRSASDIAQQIEDVGGAMNAYTSREMTSYHLHMLREDAGLGIEILADMYLRSSFPDDEIERERQVILQEIGMCNDTPDDLVFDQYFETAYPEQAFGAPILGRAETVEAMSKATMMDYTGRLYTAGRTVISAAGNVDHDAFVAKVEALLGALPEDSVQDNAASIYRGGEMRTHKDLEQSHIMIGFEGVGRLDDQFYAAQALSTLLGSGMSSRLFQEVREKRGLVYSIFSFHSGYQDGGTFGVYAGTGPEKLTEIVPVICDEVLKVSQDLMDGELSRAKAQLKANLLMGRESMMTRADQQAKHLIYRDQALDIAALIEKIDALDVAAVQAIAAQIFASKPTLTALGPLDSLEGYDSLEERLAA